MRTIEAKKNKTVCIGYQGENEAAQVLIPIPDYLQNEEGYVFSLIIQEKNEDKYSTESCELTEDGKHLVWIPTSKYTKTSGMISVEIKACRGKQVALSSIYDFVVNRSV